MEVGRGPSLNPVFFALPGTILLDCVNMAVEAGKVTPRDAHCVSRLESSFSELQPRNRVFDALQRAKFDVSGGWGGESGRAVSFKDPTARVVCRRRCGFRILACLGILWEAGQGEGMPSIS